MRDSTRILMWIGLISTNLVAAVICTIVHQWTALINIACVGLGFNDVIRILNRMETKQTEEANGEN